MKKSLPVSYIAALALLLCAGRSVAAQNVWDKPFMQWSKSEVEKIFTDSPWAKAQEERVGGVGSAPVTEKVIVRLRSALPIRQALVRYNQINSKYEKMSEAEKAAFDAKTKGLLDCPACADNYVITLNSPITRGPGDDMIARMKNETLTSLKSYVYIANEKGERRELVHFVAPKVMGDEAVLFFPRLDDKGNPLISTGNKKLIIFFDTKIFERNFPLTKMEFDISRLMYKGELAF
jgi:hypothetical protein